MYGGRGIFGQITHSNVIVRIPFHTTWVELASACTIEKMSAGERQLSVGLISGTSMDGIDACVLEITEELHTVNESVTAPHQQLK